ncbi:hypothetical protein [Ornithinibacillus californiensis]|nr:hypothetical protein [Ornithinibacillus californiensis]
MNDKTYQYIKLASFIVAALSLAFIANQIADIANALQVIADLM